jgi:hypothetical protein
MSFVIDKTVTDKPPKKTVVSQFTGNNSIEPTISCINQDKNIDEIYYSMSASSSLTFLFY